ncbi:hypothetical protein N9T21_02905 [Candidatus Pelagibacter sp.]|nr:hypothetical protein [Candidatus Pelagibacter sp.]
MAIGDKWVSLELNTIMWKNSQTYIKEIVDNTKFESPKNEKHKLPTR